MTLSRALPRPYPMLMRVAVCQLNARDDRTANLAAAEALLERAAAAGADLAVLPEYVDYLGPAAGLPDAGAGRRRVRQLLRRASPGGSGIWVVAGSFHEAGPGPGAHLQHLAGLRPLRRAGRDLPQDPPVRRGDPRPGLLPGVGDAWRPGSKPVVVDVEGVRVGLSICYDLRFPELYRRLAADGGAQLLVVPAAFMMHTGRDHWEVLLRARAIENQCFVAAAGQIGDHEPGRTCFGRSMVVDPWGTVLGQVPDGPGVVVVDLDLSGWRDPRRAAEPGQPPALSARRPCRAPSVPPARVPDRCPSPAEHPDHAREPAMAPAVTRRRGGHPGRAPPGQSCHREQDDDAARRRRSPPARTARGGRAALPRRVDLGRAGRHPC